MSLSTFRASVALAGWLAMGLSSFAFAQADAPDDADPPDRAARLSYVQGEVSLQPAGEEEWASAIVNRPLTTGDKLWTDEGARAEIYVGPAAIRLGSDTGFSFLNVDDDTIQMRMTAGVMSVRVRQLDENDHIEIDTPNLALSLLRPGKYRVEVNDEGDTTVVKVIEGEAEASGGSQDVVVHAQQAATFRGTGQLASQFASLGVPDAFDTWALERDRRDEQAQSAQTAQYVSPEVTGYEDLDANGSWSSEPEYGYVWTPTAVAVDWSPYRYGRWVWVAPWGWTWVDDAPWGYAPFHYGRWAHVRNRWCWVPGPRHVRPVYAPALVGWVGSPGVSVSVSVGGGGVAWFPLGPREVYVPARRFSPRYVERVNVTNTVIVNKTYITNVYNNRVTNVTYRNRTVPGGVTAVSRTTFTSAERVGRHTVRIDEREITRVRATGFAPQIQPARASVLGVSDAARINVRRPPATVVERQVIVKRPPPVTASHFVRNEAAGRNRPNVGNNERPPQTILRNDRPMRADRIPERINRAGDVQEREEARRQQREVQENQQRQQQLQQEQLQRRAEVDRQRSERQSQLDQQQRDQRAQFDRQRDERRAQQEQQRAELARQRNEQRTQQDQQRVQEEQQRRAEFDRQRAERAQQEQQRRQEQESQRAAAREQARTATQERSGDDRHSGRTYEERARRRPNNSNTRTP